MHGFFRGDFVAHHADGVRFRADKNKTALADFFGKIGIFGEEAVTRMDGLGVGYFGRADDGGNIQVAMDRRRRPDADGFVRQPHVFEIAVGFGIDRHGFNAEFPAGSQNA